MIRFSRTSPRTSWRYITNAYVIWIWQSCSYFAKETTFNLHVSARLNERFNVWHQLGSSVLTDLNLLSWIQINQSHVLFLFSLKLIWLLSGFLKNFEKNNVYNHTPGPKLTKGLLFDYNQVSAYYFYTFPAGCN